MTNRRRFVMKKLSFVKRKRRKGSCGYKVSDDRRTTHAVIWYVRVDDETRSAGPQEVTREQWEGIRCATESIHRAMPDGSYLYPCRSAGTVGVAVPHAQIDHVSDIDAAFVAAGYMRDPYAPNTFR